MAVPDIQKPPGDLMDVFHEGQEVCKVPKTNRKQKKNAFDKFRPVEGKYMDYNISQTDMKMDYDTTKIHMVQTRAEYVDWPEDVQIQNRAPPPRIEEKPKKHKYHGRAPCWVFLDEIRAKQHEIIQEQYKAEAKIRQKIIKQLHEAKKYGLHEVLLNMVGPDWYQELAPKQIRAIDSLKYCIAMDHKHNTVTHLKDCMAQLGLVLRPSTKHLEMALKYCCQDPIEFLLILYQIIDKNRKEYSLNDRLLLSGVVHLTMAETLRELHVRIPSPPPPNKKKSKKPEKKPAPKKYISPYLEPYTFKPEERKQKGIYKNTYKQYPDSIYFHYICDLKKRTDDWSEIIHGLTDSEEGMIMMPDRPLTIEEDLVLELLRAQESYERINITKNPTPKLLRANFRAKCNARSKTSDLDEIEAEELENEVVQTISQLAELDQLEDTDLPRTDLTISVKLKVTSDYDEFAKLTQQKIEYYMDIDERVNPTYMQCIEHSHKMFNKCEQTFLINGIYLDKNKKPVYCLGGVVEQYWKQPDEKQYNAEVERLQEQLHSSKNCFLIDGVHIGQDGLPIYGIAATYAEDHYQDYINLYQDFFTYSPTLFLIEGVRIDKEGNPVYGIQGVSANKICKCELMMARQAFEAKRAAEREYSMTMEEFKREELKRLEWEKEMKNLLMKIEDETYRKMRKIPSSTHDLVAVKKRSSPCCLCKRAVENFIKLPRCQCELCERDKHEARKVFIVEGTCVKTGEPIQIITGLTEEKECRCLERYNDQLAAFDDRRRRHDKMLDLKHMEKKFVVSGVTIGPDGEPIYILSGLIPPKRECPCRQENIRERERMLNMPQPLVPDRRYIIGGIQATPNGNVWIVSGVNSFPDCDCMKIYDAFVDRHSDCMALYEAYVAKIQRDVQEYMEEIGEPLEIATQTEFKDDIALDIVPTPIEPFQDDEDEPKFYYHEDQPQFVFQVTSGTKMEGLKPATKKHLEAVKEEQKFVPTLLRQGNIDFDPEMPHFVIMKGHDVDFEGDDIIIDNEQEFSLNLEVKKKKRVCICVPGTEGQNLDCTCSERKKKKKKVPPPPRDYKRYIILKKLPCNYELQMIILKQALSTMAEDGYPLAKLPDCYLLPHFKLWWRWRLGIYVSQEDRQELYKFSKKFWNHTEKCHRTVKFPSLPVDQITAKKFTWNNAVTVRKMTDKANNNYYRKVKQAHILDGREYFPTLCDYDLPTPSFRDCIFAYIPWKEEESFAMYPWHVHEYKDMRNAKICI